MISNGRRSLRCGPILSPNTPFGETTVCHASVYGLASDTHEIADDRLCCLSYVISTTYPMDHIFVSNSPPGSFDSCDLVDLPSLCRRHKAQSLTVCPPDHGATPSILSNLIES